MTHTYHTTFQVKHQPYYCENSESFENGKRILEFQSKQTSKDVVCPKCRSRNTQDIPYARLFTRSINTDIAARSAEAQQISALFLSLL